MVTPSSASRVNASAAAIAPSPTAPATRLVEPWRTSPAVKRPGRLVSSGSVVGAPTGNEEILAGHDVAGGVGQDAFGRAPVGVRPTADADEDGIRRLGASFAGGVGDGHAAEPPAVRVQPGQLGLEADVDQRMLLDSLDQVGGHRLSEPVAAHEHRHPSTRVGEVEHRLSG
jgi:hypothetical protein